MAVCLNDFGIPPDEKIGSSDPVNEKQELADRFLLKESPRFTRPFLILIQTFDKTAEFWNREIEFLISDWIDDSLIDQLCSCSGYCSYTTPLNPLKITDWVGIFRVSALNICSTL